VGSFLVWEKLLEKSEKVLKKDKSFFALWLCLLFLISIPLTGERFYSKNDLQYITIENATIRYQNGNRYEPSCAIINDVYYLILHGYGDKIHKEYENITSLVKSEKITIGVVEDLKFQILQLNQNCKLVITLTSENAQPYTLEEYNKSTKKGLIVDISIIAAYLLLSLVFVVIMYLLGERKYRKKWRKWKKKRKLQRKFGKK
jgi:hypothetical protein